MKMKTGLYYVAIIVLFSACSSKNKGEKKELVVYCAASLTDVISEISSEFEKEFQVQVKLNLASSGTLARQIEHGAVPAIFISANENWIDYLDSLGLAIPETEKNIAGNTMVLIAPLESPLNSFVFFNEINLPELFKGRISIGDPQYVPAGTYANQIFEKLGCKDAIEPRILPAKDVRSALMVVELGEVETGNVYKTDVLKSGKVKIITEFPDSLYEPVSYYMVLIKGQENEFSRKLYNYIVSDELASVWTKYGFK